MDDVFQWINQSLSMVDGHSGHVTIPSVLGHVVEVFSLGKGSAIVLSKFHLDIYWSLIPDEAGLLANFINDLGVFEGF